MRKYFIPLLITVLVIAYMTFNLLSAAHQNDRLLQLAKENNVYHRTNSCILSVPLPNRTDAYISNCYDMAQEKNGIKVDRFGNK